MATTSNNMASEISKPSFAKIAAASADAMSTSVSTALSRESTPPQSASISESYDVHATPLATVAKPVTNGANEKHFDSVPDERSSQTESLCESVDDAVAAGIKDLGIAEKTSNLAINGSSIGLPVSKPLATRAGSDDLISEPGTKPPSLDGKSTTSGTTFAMDEKESLRPDDSASVIAATDDDDASSLRGPLMPGSRMGSDLAYRARGIQLGDMPDRRNAPSAGILSTGPDIATPQSGTSEQQANPQLAMNPNALSAIYRQAPDERLLEAMQSTKDRLFLLHLENRLITFVQNSKEPFMDVHQPGQEKINTFYRMLAHKLADYYHMTHSYEPKSDAVRIFRTPFCRVPPSLASLAAAAAVAAAAATTTPESSTPPPMVLPRKIMRRGEDTDPASSSTDASKVASDGDGESKDAASRTKEKLTREEREEAYKMARERIFGSSEKSSDSPETESPNDVSRTSSSSGRDKSNTARRGRNGRQRRDSDSFESRHEYAAFWLPQQQQQAWPGQPQYIQIGNMSYLNQQGQQPYGSSQIPPNYSQGNGSGSGVGYPPPMSQGGYPSHYNSNQYPSSQQNNTQARYPPSGTPFGPTSSNPHHSHNMQQASAMSPSQHLNHNGSSHIHHNQQQHYPPSGPGQRATMNGAPYAFGQLPNTTDPNDPKAQHPIPGSYNRQTPFNPKIQSFVPSANTARPQIQAPQPPFTAPGSHHSSPQAGSPHLSFTGHQPPSLPHQYGNNPGYGMTRQGSTGSVPPFHSQMPPPNMHQSQPQSSYHPTSTPHHNSNQPPAYPHYQQPMHQLPNKPTIPQGPSAMGGGGGGNGQTFSQLVSYGNPASLPQKPNVGI